MDKLKNDFKISKGWHQRIWCWKMECPGGEKINDTFQSISFEWIRSWWECSSDRLFLVLPFSFVFITFLSWRWIYKHVYSFTTSSPGTSIPQKCRSIVRTIWSFHRFWTFEFISQVSRNVDRVFCDKINIYSPRVQIILDKMEMESFCNKLILSLVNDICIQTIYARSLIW